MYKLLPIVVLFSNHQETPEKRLHEFLCQKMAELHYDRHKNRCVMELRNIKLRFKFHIPWRWGGGKIERNLCVTSTLLSCFLHCSIGPGAEPRAHSAAGNRLSELTGPPS